MRLSWTRAGRRRPACPKPSRVRKEARPLYQQQAARGPLSRVTDFHQVAGRDRSPRNTLSPVLHSVLVFSSEPSRPLSWTIVVPLCQPPAPALEHQGASWNPELNHITVFSPHPTITPGLPLKLPACLTSPSTTFFSLHQPPWFASNSLSHVSLPQDLCTC